MAQKILKTKIAKITLIATAINIAALSIISQSIQIDTIIALSLVALAVISLVKIKKPTAMNAAILGALIPSTYNILGQLFGLFAVEPTTIVLGGLQQGIIAYVVAKVGGLK